VDPSQHLLPDAPPAMEKRRISFEDGFSVFLVLALVCLAALMTSQAVDEYRAQRAADAVFNARPPQVIVQTRNSPQVLLGAPYDPAFAEKLISEAIGCVLVLTLAVLARRRRWQRAAVEAQVKWIVAPQQRPAVSAVAPVRAEARQHPPPSSVAAERLAVVVWNDNVVRHERVRESAD
jgi:hypothetical protein